MREVTGRPGFIRMLLRPAFLVLSVASLVLVFEPALQGSIGAVAGADSLNLIGNGSFETSVSFTSQFVTLEGGDTTSIAPWTVDQSTPDWSTAASVDLVTSSYFQAEDGSNSVDLEGTPGPGAVSQVVQTVAGTEYALSWWMAANPSCGTKTYQMDVYWNGNQVADPTFTAQTVANMGWVEKDETVTGNGNPVEVQFATPLTGPSTDCGATLDNVALTPISGSVEASLSSSTSTVAGVETVPVSALDGAGGSGSSASSGGASSAPLSSIPLSSIPLSSINLASSPLASIPLSSIPLSSIALPGASGDTAIAAAQQTLSSTIVADIGITFPNGCGVSGGPTCTGWTGVLAGTPYAGVPLEAVTLSDVLGNPTAAANFDSVDLGALDLSSTPLASIPMSSIELGATPLSSIDIGGSTSATALSAWCTQLSTLGFDCSSDFGIDVSTGNDNGVTLFALALAGVPMSSIPLSSIPLSSISLSSSPLSSIPLASIPLSSIPLSSIPLSSIALVASIVNCSTFDCADDTLGQASADGAILPGATLADLSESEIASTTPVTTFGDLLLATIPPGSYPWSATSLSGLPLAADGSGGGTVSYTGTLTVTGATSIVNVAVVLPATFAYVPGSSKIDGAGAPDPSGTSTLQWTFTLPVGTHTLGFTANAGIGLGPATATISAAVSIGGDPSATSTVDVVDGEEPTIEAPATAMPLHPGTPPSTSGNLNLGYLTSPGDLNDWSVTVPSNDELSVALTNLPATYDLQLFGPSGQQLQGTPTQNLGGVTDAVPTLSPGGTTEDTPGSEDLPITPPAGDVLEAVSNNPDGQSQYIQTPPLVGGTYIVQVSGYNGASSSAPYLLQANLLGGATNPSCPGGIGFVSSLPAAASGPVTIPSNANTLFLVDTQRLSASYGGGSESQILSDVQAVANDSAAGVVGAVVPVDSFSSVQSAYATWNANPCSVVAANGVVAAISSVVDEIRAAHASIQNLVIVGPDDQIPLARIADGVTDSNERDYGSSTFAGENNVEADALSLGYYFSDDPFAASQPLGVGSATLYLPQLAVGRLVESATEIESALTRFVSSGGNLDATASLTTGYSFLTSGAQAVSANLAADGLTASNLINETWTESDLDAALAASPTPGVDSVNAHFDYSRALPAYDNTHNVSTNLVTTADVRNPPDATSYAGRLLFSMGCHAGLDIDDAEVATSGVTTPVDDWAKTFADAGALWVANTGYGYADTDTIAYSAKLMANFAADLNGSATIGEALSEAKQAYASDDALPSPYDLKALMESTFYGLPMYTLNKPPTPVAPATGPSTVVIDPTTGLSEFSTALSFNLGSGNSTAPGQLGLIDTANGDYYQVNGTTASNAGTLTTEFRPIEPLITDTVTEPGLSPHGELVTALSSTDVADPTPAYSLPAAGSANSTPTSIGNAAFPGTLGRVATYGTFTAGGTGQGAELDLAAGQFLPSQTTPGSGTERLFNTLSVQAFFLSPTSPYANDYTPPTIDSTTTSASGANSLFDVVVTPAGAPVTQVLVLYTDASHPGTWTSTELSSSDGINWTGSGALPSSGQVQYMVQALDGAGNVAFSNNEGTAFNSNVKPAPISISLAGSGPTNGTYTGAVTATISAPNGSTYALDGASPAAVPANSEVVVSAPGPHSLSVTDPANVTVTQDFVISDDQTSTSLGANINPAVEGQTVTLTATVDSLSQGAPSPSGNVEFLDGTTPVAACGGAAGVPLSSDTATCAVSYSSPGQKQLIASYLGNGTLATSQSSQLSLGVNARTASIMNFTASGPVAYGNEQNVLFSATVTANDSDPMPTGDTVTLSAGATPVCVINLTPGSGSSATGTCHPTSATALPVGLDTVTAVFNASGTDTSFAVVAPMTTGVSIGKAAPTISWATPAAITFGTALSTTQLNATASVPGTFVYNPPIGNVPNPGTDPLSVTFTPSDSTDYSVATDSVNLVVNKVTPVITWATPTAITYGTALSATQLDATASVPGTFVYTPALGSFPKAGNDNLSVTFTPSNSADYATVTSSVTLVVHPATLLILASTTSMTYGSTPPSIGASYVGFVAHDTSSALTTMPSCTSGATSKSNVGVYLTICSGAVDPNYSITYVPGVIAVLPATPTVSWATPAAITSKTALSSKQLDATASVPGTFSYSPTAGTVLSAGTHVLSVKFTPTASGNYLTVTKTVSITVTKA